MLLRIALLVITVMASSEQAACASDSSAQSITTTAAETAARDTVSPRQTRWLDRLLDNVQFLPYHHMYIDLNMFLFHKNGFFRQSYFLENSTQFEFALLAIRRKLYSVWGFDLGVGMGKTPRDILFDPADVSFGIIPVIEYRTRNGLRVQGGVEHRCFHEIDRLEMPTVYWNKAFLALGSHNMRLGNYWHTLIKAGPRSWTLRNRLSWYLRGGYFVKRFFGIIDENTLNGENDAILCGHADLRFAIYRRRSWVVCLRELLEVGSYRKGAGDVGGYVIETLGIEAHFRRGIRAGMLFVDFTLDNHPYQVDGKHRFSRDQLMQIGVAFYI